MVADCKSVGLILRRFKSYLLHNFFFCKFILQEKKKKKMIEPFYFLKFVCILSALLLVLANKNPIYSVLYLVTLFVAGSFTLFYLGLDFLPYIFIIVYAGAVAVLFLFVVIILRIKLGAPQTTSAKEILFILGLACVINSFTYSLLFPPKVFLWRENYSTNDEQTSLISLGKLLYTEYNFHFVVGGLLLLVAIVGAIVLTSRRQSTSLKQKTSKQEERLNVIGMLNFKTKTKTKPKSKTN